MAQAAAQDAAQSAEASDDDILLQIEGLTFDSLQVVSYKWLSRNFSVSSNAAKRLLQKFADQNTKADFEIVYAVSGWSSKEPHTYAIQLVPKSRLEEASAALKGAPSIHVYSVQRTLSKDPAQLWCSEYTQAEHLFSEASGVNNCLRDNRFSAVTCDLVQRSSRKRPRVASSAQPSSSNGPTISPAPAISLPKAQAETLPARVQESNVKDALAGKKPTAPSAKKLPNESKDSSAGAAAAGKKKAAPSVTGGSGGGSSLASMWGKAPAAKSKTPASSGAAAAVSSPAVAGDAEAKIRALEAEDGSEDDDLASEFASMRRGQSNLRRGRRRMVIDNMDDGDDDDDAHYSERIIRLGSPESPHQRNGRTVASTQDANLALEHHDLASNEQKEFPSHDKDPSTLQQKTSPERHGGREAEITVNGKTSIAETNGLGTPVSDFTRDTSKRKKVLKTTTDSRGREVTEVVWETGADQAAAEDLTKHSASSRATDVHVPAGIPQPAQRPPMASKSSTSKASAKPSAKSAGKPAKGQGSITAFFKKT